MRRVARLFKNHTRALFSYAGLVYKIQEFLINEESIRDRGSELNLDSKNWMTCNLTYYKGCINFNLC